MLTAAVVSTDAASSASILKCLRQTGLVSSTLELGTSAQSHPALVEAVPDVALLDLVGDVEPYFAFAALLRRLRPAIRIIACSAQAQPESALLLRAMRSGVQEFLPKPLDPLALRDALVRFAQERDVGGTRTVRKVFVVMGAKGGVGTTTVAVNLASQLVQISKKRVVLLDLARPLGHVSLLLDLQPRFSIRDAVENQDRLDAHFFGGLLGRHKSGVEVLAGTSRHEDWERITGLALAHVVEVARSYSDYVVLDAGAQYLSDLGSLLCQAHRTLLVAEANVPSLWSLERFIAKTAALGIDPDRLQIVINRWRRSDEEALKSVEKNMKRSVFMRLPNDFRQVSKAVDMGVPLSLNHGNALASKFRQLAHRLSDLPAPAPEKRGAFAGLFSFQPSR